MYITYYVIIEQNQISWATDHSHLHEAVLMPRWASHLSRNKQGSPSYLSPYNNSDSGYKHPNIVTLVQRSADCLTVERAVKGPNVSFPMPVTGKLVLRPVGKTMQDFLTLLITFLIEVVKDGFQLHPADASIVQAEMDNYFSALLPRIKQKEESSILEEIEAGNYAITTHKPTIISALRAVLKPDSDELRLIHDCSMPPSLGVNNHIAIEKQTF